MSPSIWTSGLLLIDGKPVSACSFNADMARELVRPDDTPLAASYEFRADLELDGGEWREFCKLARINAEQEPVTVDLTVWGAIDPAGPMPVVSVGRHTAVITKCARGGGSLGRRWLGAELLGFDGADLHAVVQHP